MSTMSNEPSAFKPRTVGELRTEFMEQLQRTAAAGHCAARTVEYYRYWLDRWVGAVGADKPLAEVVAYDLERYKIGWHSVQTVQRMWNWAADMDLFGKSPVAKVTRPPLGERQRVLTRGELVRLLRAAKPALRRFMLGMVGTLARPQEVRSLRWWQLTHVDGQLGFVLSDFKGKARRKDGVKVRVVLVNARLGRLLDRLRRQGKPGPDDFVFRNSWGKPWTSNYLHIAMRRLCQRCGLEGQDPTERIVCYTLRHTSATLATANGVRDRVLAELMGHADTRMTRRYQHLQLTDLGDAIEQATRPRRSPGPGPG